MPLTRSSSRRTGRSNARRQGGFIAVLILVILVVGSLYLVVSGLSTTAAEADLQRGDVTALALQQAKEALIGRAALDANRPGSLPCPDLDNDGNADSFPGSCLSYIGRLPWKTLGLPDLRDATGERLWYAFSQNFTDWTGYQINSDTQGTLTVPGMAPTGGIVAIVFAPGRPLGTQTRGGPAGACTWTVDDNCKVLNYLEGQNASIDTAYEQTPRCERADCPGGYPINDQLMIITHADLFAIVEPVVAKRIEKDIVPQLNNYFQLWGQALYGDPQRGFFPFAAPYIDTTFTAPDDDPRRVQNNYRGAIDQTNGLLPLSTDTSDQPGPPFVPAWVRWEGITVEKANPTDPGTLTLPTPSGGPGDGLGPVAFTYTYTCAPPPPCPPELNVRLTARLKNVVTSFLLPTNVTDSTSWLVTPPGVSAPAVATKSIDSAPLSATYGDLVLTVTFSLPSAALPTPVNVTFPAVNPSWFLAVTNPSDPTTGWFVQNEWHRQTYYAVSDAFKLRGDLGTRVVADACATATTPPPCINVVTGPPKARAVLVLAGRHIGTGTRTYTIANYFEDQNLASTPATTADTPDYIFERKQRSNLFNDRLVVVATEP